MNEHLPEISATKKIPVPHEPMSEDSPFKKAAKLVDEIPEIPQMLRQHSVEPSVWDSENTEYKPKRVPTIAIDKPE